MKEKFDLNPWLSMWIHPRKTMQALKGYDINHRLFVLSMIYGFQWMLGALQFFSFGYAFTLFFIFLVAAVLSIPAGYIIFNFMGAFYYWMGKIVRGKGSFKEVRAATAWSSVPMIITILIWIFLMLLYGNGVFISGYEKKLIGTAAMITAIAGLGQLVMFVWSVVIFLHALGEVQGFSSWMAFLNLILAWIASFVLLFLVSWGVSSLIHVT